MASSVTITEARKLLGEKYSHLSDEYIENLILQFENLASSYIRSAAKSSIV